MTKQKGRDKNIQNINKDFQHSLVNSHQAQQFQQDTNDRKHEDALNHKSEAQR